MLRALLRVFGLHFGMLGLVLFMLELGLRTVQPLCLLKLISYYTYGTDSKDNAYYYAAGVVACSALNVIIMHPYMLGTMHVGMKMRVAICSMIYRKSLRLSKTALGDTTAGHIVNLMSNDVGRLDLATIFVHYLWVGPLQTLFITYLMYLEVGVALPIRSISANLYSNKIFFRLKSLRFLVWRLCCSSYPCRPGWARRRRCSGCAQRCVQMSVSG